MKILKRLSRLRYEWTKNDGKPREHWAAGPDLRETVSVVALAVLLIIQIGATVWWIMGQMSR